MFRSFSGLDRKGNLGPVLIPDYPIREAISSLEYVR
jgi:hypothetical protein